MKKILLAVLFASTHLYAADDEYPTCDPSAEDMLLLAQYALQLVIQKLQALQKINR